MKSVLSIISISMLIFCSCVKRIEPAAAAAAATDAVVKNTPDTAVSNACICYTIAKGQQYCDKNIFQQVSYQELKFVVKFDSSAIYKTVDTNNEDDINKLYGFSDNNKTHHEFSARFGWRWKNNALTLFAYIYNNSEMSFKELGNVAIGTENNCSIKVSGSSYIFSLNGHTDTLPRVSTTARAEGYRLYPYFGGDETAPHNISIWIQEL